MGNFAESPAFVRERYWELFSSRRTPRPPLLFHGNYTSSFILPETTYSKLHELTFTLIQKSLSTNLGISLKELTGPQKILDSINQTQSLSVVRDWDLLTQIEAILYQELLNLDLLTDITGIEFPVNIRVAHGKPPPGYAETDYATDHLHCDIWAGEPSDIVQGLIYLDGDLSSTYMELFDCTQSTVKAIEGYTGSYKGGSSTTQSCPHIPYIPQKGQLILFDGVCPHKTVRRDGQARVSLDFRLRRTDPYAILDQRWSRDRLPWAKYWLLPQAGTRLFKARCENEIGSLLKMENSTAAEARRGWLKKQHLID